MPRPQPAAATTAAPRRSEPPRVLGPLDATGVVVGAIIGVGIFFTPSDVARLAGSPELTMLAWVCGGAIAMLGALTFAALGAVHHGAGAQYAILRDAYGPLPAFLFVFCNATAIQAGAIAIIAIVCARNLVQAASGFEAGPRATHATATVLILALMAANAAGARAGATIQNITVVAKIAVLVAVVAVAAAFAGPPPEAPAAASPPPAPGPGGPLIALLFAAMVPAFFSYGGWQHALWIAGEVRAPARNLPRATIVGVAIVVTVYVLANWGYLRLLGYDGVVASKALAADAVAGVWPDWGRRAVAGGVAVSAFGVLNAQLLSGPRLIYRLAADGRFPAAFARTSAARGTPWAAILLLGGLALVLLFAVGEASLGQLLTGVVFIDSVFFALTGCAPLILARRDGLRFRFGYPVVPVVFVLAEIGLLIGAYQSPDTRLAAWVGLAWIAGATVLYLCMFRRRPAISDQNRERH